MLAQEARPSSSSRKDEPGNPVYVYVWFDIEDYVTVESDDLPLIALATLEKYGARATCKMVAEKVRVLLDRNRTDVIAAIGEHDVGYHLDTHSVHPVVYEYFADLDTVDGAREFEKKERDGQRLVERTFGRRVTCFGHPGPAWSPHFYPAMRRMGIPVYLDDTAILNLNGQPYWYCGVLNLNGAGQNFLKFDYTFESPSGLSKLKRQFEEIHDRLARQDGGGCISFLFHLHTAINKEFWDAVNFADGKNRTNDHFVRPPAQSEEVTARAWRDFDEIVRFMSSFNDVKFITASDAIEIFKRHKRSFDRPLLQSVLDEMGRDVQYARIGDDFCSPSELFYTIAKFLSTFSETGELPSTITAKEPFGPAVKRGKEHRRREIPRRLLTRELLDACTKVVAEMDSTGRLPVFVTIGHSSLDVSDFMITSANVLRGLLAGGHLPATTPFLKGRFVHSKFVDKKAFHTACTWTVLPRGFKAPRILQEIILQTWTLRPAVATRTQRPKKRIFRPRVYLRVYPPSTTSA